VKPKEMSLGVRAALSPVVTFDSFRSGLQPSFTRREAIAPQPPARPERATRSRGNVSAAIVLDQWHLAQKILGKAVIDQARAALSPKARAELEALLPVSWCSLTTATEIHFAVADAAQLDPVAWHRRLVRVGMERTFTTFWRVMMRLTSVEAMIKRAAIVYAKSYDRGAATARLVEPGLVEFVISGWPHIPDFEVDAVCSGIEAMIRISGRTSVSIESTRLDDGARFAIRFAP
jgi:hypothetical protein